MTNTNEIQALRRDTWDRLTAVLLTEGVVTAEDLRAVSPSYSISPGTTRGERLLLSILLFTEERVALAKAEGRSR